MIRDFHRSILILLFDICNVIMKFARQIHTSLWTCMLAIMRVVVCTCVHVRVCIYVYVHVCMHGSNLNSSYIYSSVQTLVEVLAIFLTTYTYLHFNKLVDGPNILCHFFMYILSIAYFKFCV